MKNRKFGMAGVGSANGEMDFLTVPTKITPVKQMMAELQSDDEEPGLGYTHTLVSTHNWDIVHIGLSDRRI